MLVINGVDITLPLALVFIFGLLFATQYLLCDMADGKPLRHLPLAAPVLLLFSAGRTYFTEVEASLVEMRNSFALMTALYAMVGIAGIVLARILHKRKNRK